MGDERNEGVDTVSKLYAESQRRKERNSILRKELEATRAELVEIKSAHDKMTQELETIRSLPDKVKEELTLLKGKIRLQMHQEAFKVAAEKHKILPTAVEDLYKLTGYKSDADDVNEEEIGGLIAEAIKDRPYLVSPEEKPTLQAGPGYSRGPSSNGIFTATESQLADHMWMRDNHSKVVEARKTGSFKILPG